MVTKRKTAKRAAPRRRTYAASRAAPRRRTVKNGYDKIGPAAATVALVAVNAGRIKNLANAVTNNGNDPISKWPGRLAGGFTGSNNWIHNSLKKFVATDALATDALAVVGGYAGGELVRKYAPTMIKKPLGKIAKKIPKVF